MALPERIEARIDRSGECHIWTGAKTHGYGRVNIGGKSRLVHRVVYELEVGPIPGGLELDHIATRGCTSRACVRLDHLEVVTHAENMRRRAHRTHCPQGHPYDEANTYVYGNDRKCRRCNADRARARRAGK